MVAVASLCGPSGLPAEKERTGQSVLGKRPASESEDLNKFAPPKEIKRERMCVIFVILMVFSCVYLVVI